MGICHADTEIRLGPFHFFNDYFIILQIVMRGPLAMMKAMATHLKVLGYTQDMQIDL